MITYDDYSQRYNDDMEEDEFNILFLNIRLFIESYTESYISKFNLKDNFDDYGLDLDEAVMQQMHYVYENGGLDVFEGANDVSVKSISTSGFSYSYGNNNISSFHGIPIAPMSKVLIQKELRKKNYLGRCIYG